MAKDAKKNPRAFYKYVNSKKFSKDKIGPLNLDGNLIETDSDIATCLNEFFSSVFTSENLDSLPVIDKIDCTAPDLDWPYIDQIQVTKKLKNLKPFSAPGPDGINPRALINLADDLSFPLTYIFNLSLKEGNVPEDWKCANVTPLFKKGSKSSPGNYRPVSLTSVICKVMESLLKDFIVSHLNSYSLINDTQHGFMSRKSCLTNLLEYLEKLTDLIDQGHAVDVIYFDFAKAFDKVAHQRLSLVLSRSSLHYW